MQNHSSSPVSKSSLFSRRQFLGRTALVAGASLSFPYVGNVLGANDRINIACIGVTGKGDSDSSDAARNGGTIVAICDVDETHLETRLNKRVRGDADGMSFKDKFPHLKKYTDYRKMLDEMGSEIDAVTVSVPDHHHGVASIRAMKMSKHVFCQKPLVQTVNEARIMRKLAKEKNLATQMGNQGSAHDGLRRAVEVVQAGVIGKPLELHVWTNRPIWPQGLDRPASTDAIPSTLAWDNWLGPAQKRPFKKDVYHPFKWRGWYDFGTGALGDMACHTVNMPFRALKLGYPNVVECELASRMYSETFPKTSRIRFEFPAREDLPPLKFWWYDGNPEDHLRPIRPPIEAVHEVITTYDTLPIAGALIIVENGKLFSTSDYGESFKIAMKGKDQFVDSKQIEACQAVAKTIPRCPGENHMGEWFRMMKDGTPAYSNFDIAAYLTEIILLGCIALRVGEGRRMEWDGPNMHSPNVPEAAHFVKRDNRKGWEA